ncbi:MAG: hypothetical protein L0G46_02645, partial [Kocuria sp.]|nr:hypothetical protein [Kocuria sp.]
VLGEALGVRNGLAVVLVLVVVSLCLVPQLTSAERRHHRPEPKDESARWVNEGEDLAEEDAADRPMPMDDALRARKQHGEEDGDES